MDGILNIVIGAIGGSVVPLLYIRIRMRQENESLYSQMQTRVKLAFDEIDKLREEQGKYHDELLKKNEELFKLDRKIKDLEDENGKLRKTITTLRAKLNKYIRDHEGED